VPVNVDDYEPLCSFQNAINVELPSLHKKITSNLDKIGKCLIQYKQAVCSRNNINIDIKLIQIIGMHFTVSGDFG
jgi:hypothetical protein